VSVWTNRSTADAEILLYVVLAQPKIISEVDVDKRTVTIEPRYWYMVVRGKPRLRLVWPARPCCTGELCLPFWFNLMLVVQFRSRNLIRYER